MRKSVAAWQLLQRMSQAEVALIFNAETGRTHFMQHCRVMDPVHPGSMDLLMDAGFVHRERSAIPVYTITEKGRDALKHREVPEEISDEANALSCAF